MSRCDDRRQKMRERLQKQLVAREADSHTNNADERLQKCEQDLSFLMEGLDKFFNVTLPKEAFLCPVEDQPENSNINNKSPNVKEAILLWSEVLQFLNQQWPRVEHHFLAGEGQGTPRQRQREVVAGNNVARNFVAEGREKWKRLQCLSKELPEDSVIPDPARLNIFPTSRRKAVSVAKRRGMVRVAGVGR